MPTPVTTFISAARAFQALVAEVPEDAWDGPGLGDWDLRSLVGHAARSLITTATYSRVPADHEDLPDAPAYYAAIRAALTADSAAIVERGRQAGRDLGDDPVGAINELTASVTELVTVADDGLIQVIGGLGIRLHEYLDTRTFELAVHSIDIARAINEPFTLPDDVLVGALTLAARTAAAIGGGAALLAALTGRATLPDDFSVV